MDVFSAYIEMSQNIRHYTAAQGYGEPEATATVVIAESAQGSYVVSAGNVVEDADGQRLLERVSQLASLDKAELKSLYKEQLRRPRDEQQVQAIGNQGTRNEKMVMSSRWGWPPMNAARESRNACCC